MGINRLPIEQTVVSLAIAVGTGPTPIAQSISTTSMIQSILVCNFSTNANSLFFGDNNVTTATGAEIVVGTSYMFVIEQDRQLYELQDVVLQLAQMVAMITGAQMGCAPQGQIDPISIPVVVWNPQNLYLVAAAAQPASLQLFRNVYI